jgi:hypothetical protein
MERMYLRDGKVFHVTNEPPRAAAAQNSSFH